MISAFRKDEDEVALDDDWDVEAVGARFLDTAEAEADDETAEGSAGDAAEENDARV